MPNLIKAALTTDLAISPSPSATPECPTDIQYMPPGVHRINARRDGQPVSLAVTVHASTADNLNRFLAERLTLAAKGTEDRPFFDFNHEGEMGSVI